MGFGFVVMDCIGVGPVGFGLVVIDGIGVGLHCIRFALCDHR